MLESCAGMQVTRTGLLTLIPYADWTVCDLFKKYNKINFKFGATFFFFRGRTCVYVRLAGCRRGKRLIGRRHRTVRTRVFRNTSAIIIRHPFSAFYYFFFIKDFSVVSRAATFLLGCTEVSWRSDLTVFSERYPMMIALLMRGVGQSQIFPRGSFRIHLAVVNEAVFILALGEPGVLHVL